MLTQEEIMVLEHAIDNVFSLAGYLAYLNQNSRDEMAANPGLWCSEFTEDLAHWYESGIYTARDLANELDACFDKEVRKSMMDQTYEEMDRIYASRQAQELEETSRRVAKALEVKSASLADIWPS